MAGGTSDATAPGEDIDTSAYPGDSSGHLHPDLLQFVNDQPTDMGQAWSAVAADRAQGYITARSNAIDAMQAEQETVNNLDTAKNGLVGMVQNDPGSTDLALDLAQHSVNGIVDQHQHLGDDARGAIATSLTRSIQTEIAHASVQRIAQTDKQAALDALDRYGDYLPDDQQAALRQYADVHEVLRAQDGVAQQQQQARDAAHAGYGAATRYLSSLADTSTGGFRAPPGFLQNLLDDANVAMPTKLALRAGYGMLNRNGDVPASDPHIVADLVGRMADASVYDTNIARRAFNSSMGQSEHDILNSPRPTSVAPVWAQPAGSVPGDAGTPGTRDTDKNGEQAPWEDPNGHNVPIVRPFRDAAVQQGEIISHLGTGLTVADAGFLNSLLGPADPQRQADIRQLASVVNQARDALASPLHGAAGDAAFGRFTNWLLPALQRGGSLKELTDGNYLQAFAPTVADYRRSLLMNVADRGIFAPTDITDHGESQADRPWNERLPRGDDAAQNDDMERARPPGTGDKSAVPITQDDAPGEPFLGGEGGADLGSRGVQDI